MHVYEEFTDRTCTRVCLKWLESHPKALVEVWTCHRTRQIDSNNYSLHGSCFSEMSLEFIVSSSVHRSSLSSSPFHFSSFIYVVWNLRTTIIIPFFSRLFSPVWCLLCVLCTVCQQCEVKLARATARRAGRPPASACSGSPAPPEGRRLRAPAAVVPPHR